MNTILLFITCLILLCYICAYIITRFLSYFFEINVDWVTLGLFFHLSLAFLLVTILIQ